MTPFPLFPCYSTLLLANVLNFHQFSEFIIVIFSRASLMVCKLVQNNFIKLMQQSHICILVVLQEIRLCVQISFLFALFLVFLFLS